MKKRYWGFCFVLLFSCSTEKSQINYGQEGCSYCQMMIMDQRFGAEIVTGKGKIYKFDAMECLLNFKMENPDIATVIATEWTNVHNEDSMLYAAHECTYLRSPNLPSPMGMYINTYKDLKTAEAYQKEHGGELFTWTELNNRFNDLASIKNE